MLKKIKWIVLGLFVLLLIGVTILLLFLDAIIKSAVQTQGTEQLKVTTTLDGVDLSLLRGTLKLVDFSIGSPQGFNAPKMMSLGGLDLDTGGVMALRNEPIHIPAIRISQPQLVIEQSGGKLNFKVLLDQLPGGSTHGASSPPPPSSPSTSGNGVKLIIDDLTMSGASVVIRPGIPGVKDEITLSIPAIEVKNIGNADGNQNGAAIRDVVATLITQMVGQTVQSGQLPPEVKLLLSGNITSANVENAAKNEIQNVAQQLGGNKPIHAKSIEKDFLNQLTGPTSQPAK